MNGAEKPHARPAAITDENIDGKYSFEELSPRISPRPPARTFAGFPFAGSGALLSSTARMKIKISRRRCGNYHRPPRRRWRQHAAISHQVKPRRRHQSRQLLYQIERFVYHMGRAVPPAALEPIQKPAVRHYRQTIGRHRRPTGISAKPFQPHSVMRGNADIRMHIDT
jgi:hypothetical protein